MLRNIGGYRSEFDGAQDFDLTLRFLRYTDRVVHIPHVLYHWRVWEQSTAQSPEAKPYAEGRARKALAEFLDSKNENYEIHDGPYPGHHRVKFLPKGVPLVSIIIPTANGTIDVKGVNEWHIDAVIQSILNITTYKNYEFIIVHNGNLLPDQEKFFAEQKNLKLIYYDSKVFSLSEKINLGSTYAKGEYLVIMNDDIRVISEDWLDLMVGMVQREGVGVVGPKLLFPDETIQHAGVVLLGGLPGHAYYQWPKNSDGYALGAKVDRNYLAVTGACAITPKWLFDKVGGYSLRYPLNYNDIDYCLKLHRMGYRSVYLANIELYHYEGVSKEGGRSVADLEIEKFLQDWSHIYQYDPYYNPNLSQYAPYQFG
jgi:glycosyltransferase involved in cell wall biosynthesis